MEKKLKELSDRMNIATCCQKKKKNEYSYNV